MAKAKPYIVGEIWYDHAGNECYYRENGTISCRTVNDEDSMAIQSEKDSCNPALIYAKYMRTGLMTNVRQGELTYGDFSNAVDYHDAVFKSQQAQEDFLQLPADIRIRFDNDPGQLIDFLNDNNNYDEAVKLGLVSSTKVDPTSVSLDVTGGTDTKGGS